MEIWERLTRSNWEINLVSRHYYTLAGKVNEFIFKGLVGSKGTVIWKNQVGWHFHWFGKRKSYPEKL